jgi:dihydroxynaphthoic acid synthetase
LTSDARPVNLIRVTEFRDILYEKHHRVHGAAWLTINRPDLMNSFTGRTLDEMRAVVQDAAADSQVGVLVITGAGDRAFCAGGDVRWLQEVQREGTQVPIDPHAGIEDFLKPVIARVNGYAIGGGNHLAYFCDFTIASDRATFAQVGPRVGSPASGHWVSYLTHVVGAKKAKEIWMLTRRYSAQEALEMGLVNAVVPHEELDDEVDRWCAELMQKSPSCLRILKASFRELFQPLRESRRDWVGEFAPDFYQTGEADEGKIAFLERRDSDFSRFLR